MTNSVRFTKMQGAGNDYIYVYIPDYPVSNPEQKAVEWSAPHTGIGSDGLVLIGKSDQADFSMRIFNADGSEAMMCGNASRCVGKYVYEKGLTNKRNVTLETLSGIKKLKLTIFQNEVTEVTVDMGIPVISESISEIAIEGQTFTGTVVSMGNPHLVIFVKEIDDIDIPFIGPLLEKHPLFPDRTNVEFVQLLSPNEIRMRVWERGSGITLACGTGACASAVAAIKEYRAEHTVNVNMDGGSLIINWDDTAGNVFMTGDAVTVFEGEIA